MPIDILLAIVAQADPPTLLSLARVSRIFAELLLSKHRRFIWDDAMARDGFPDLEAQTTETKAHSVTYIAKTVYDHHCHCLNASYSFN
ncbi:BQ2448_8102 [Microbotryum intermedium]|uniref:BQ2448_8102 protein n=1 Tax=Microbotryum intermedium TaxID=269621 RepID=A0A238FR46_9BASI|nr:BQ2448_8102 [Microbotryum intermedium]